MQVISFVTQKGGSGKTTLASLLPRFYDADAGEILLDGRPVQDYELSNLRSHISFVSQDIVLFNDSIENNLAYGQLRHCSRSQILQAAEAAHIIDFVKDMPNGFETNVGDRGVLLSGGQRQRVAMGRAIVRNPRVFLFDEPLSNLDAKLRQQMRIEIKRVHQHLNTTTVYVTHDQVEAMTLADRVVVMNNGLIEQVGTPSELYHQPKTHFVAGFIGSPKMNFLPVKVTATAIDQVSHGGCKASVSSLGQCREDATLDRLFVRRKRRHQCLSGDGFGTCRHHVAHISQVADEFIRHRWKAVKVAPPLRQDVLCDATEPRRDDLAG